MVAASKNIHEYVLCICEFRENRRSEKPYLLEGVNEISFPFYPLSDLYTYNIRHKMSYKSALTYCESNENRQSESHTTFMAVHDFISAPSAIILSFR